MALKKIFRLRNIVIFIIVLAIGGYIAAQAFIFGKKEVEYDTIKAYRGDLVQTVDVTGTVRALAEINLSFETSGTLASTTVEVGDMVIKGDVLAELDNQDLQFEVDQAKAALDLAEANYNLKIAGETTQAISVSAADVAKAEASLYSAEVNLDQAELELENAQTTTQDDVEKAELAVTAALNTLNIRQAEYSNTMSQTTANVDDQYEDAVIILKNSLTAMATALSDVDDIVAVDDPSANTDFQAYLSVLDSGALTAAENSYILARNAKDQAYDVINPLSTASSHDDIWEGITEADNALNFVHQALTDTRRVLDNTITSYELTLDELNLMKSTIDTDLNTVNTRLTTLVTQKQVIQNLETTNTTSQKSAELALTAAQDAYDQSVVSLESARNIANTSLNSYEAAVETARASRDIQKAALDAAKAALDLKKANPRSVDLAPLQAQVESAQAAYNLASNRLAKSQIIAPDNGIVIKINYEVGEQVSMGTASANQAVSGGVITMLATDLFDVEVDIPETDIVKVSTGDPAEITLDAFGDEMVFYGEVIEIEPAETLIQDVVYYRVKVKIEFTAEQAVKNGMTANVVIKTDERNNAIIIPRRSVIIKDDKRIVRILKNGKVAEIEPALGLQGDNGLTEVISGVNEGDEVITAIREE